uniref:Uncharacterized protein n=1 Tax=Hucho hucho TaxID=62062 RepID=A0A4W5KNN0_9TELE
LFASYSYNYFIHKAAEVSVAGVQAEEVQLQQGVRGGEERGEEEVEELSLGNQQEPGHISTPAQLQEEQDQQGPTLETTEDHTQHAESIIENLQRKITSLEGAITKVTPDSESADTEPIELETQLNPTVEQEQDLQALLDQLHQERDSLNRLVQKLSLTEREQVLYTEPGGRGKRGSRLDSFLRSVEEERDYYIQEADSLRRMLRGRCSCSPCRGHLQSRSPTRQSPVKGGSYDSELMRVLRERDEMQNMLDKNERHLSEIQANVKVLTADRDKTSMHYQQAQQEIALLRREVLKSKSSRTAKSSVTVSAQSILKRVEAERDEAKVDLHRMSTERDSLRERLKVNILTRLDNNLLLNVPAWLSIDYQ